MKKFMLMVMLAVAMVGLSACANKVAVPHVVTQSEVSAAGKILNDPNSSKEDLSKAGKIMADWRKQQQNQVK